MYKLTNSGVINLENNMFIPECLENEDWQAYQAWLNDGNTPNPQYTETELPQLKIKALQSLKMTPRDFIIGLQGLGVSFKDTIEPLLAQNEQARIELNYCQFVYRGNELLDLLCPVLGITPAQLDELFLSLGNSYISAP